MTKLSQFTLRCSLRRGLSLRRALSTDEDAVNSSAASEASSRGRHGSSFRRRSIVVSTPTAVDLTTHKQSNRERVAPQLDSKFLSDLEEQEQMEGDQKTVRPRIDPRERSIILFPGQGSQFIGMGAKTLTYPGVKEMFSTANKILGYDLLDLCINGPKEQLDKTVHCQPAVFVTSLAGINKLKVENPKAIEMCAATAGFSVGEYASLVFAGVISFEEALELVKVRAEAMQRASEQVPSGMMSVFVGAASKLGDACQAARHHCERNLHIQDPVCNIANFLQAECKVVAGHTEALKFLEEHTKEFALRRTKWLPVSGAFHTQLMKPASRPVFNKLQNIALKKPSLVVHSNVTSQAYRNEEGIKKLLVQQVYKAVKWEQTMHLIYSRDQDEHYPWTYEVGPGKQLGTLLKLINGKAYRQYKNIEV